MDAAIRKRAEAVRSLGEYIGFFEWLAWSALKKIRLEMLFGNHVLDLQEFIAPWLVSGSAVVCRVAVVKFIAQDLYEAATIAEGLCANHFVACKVVSSSASCSPPVGVAPKNAKKAAMQVGWMMLPTDATGNCGIDVMAYSLGLERCPATWKAIREELAQYMVEISNDPLWQEACSNCAENGPGAVWGGGHGLGPPLGAAPLCTSASASSSWLPYHPP